MSRHFLSLKRMAQHQKDVSPPKILHKFNTPNKNIHQLLFMELDEWAPKFIWKNKHSRITRKTLERKTARNNKPYQVLKHTLKPL